MAVEVRGEPDLRVTQYFLDVVKSRALGEKQASGSVP
jgi:hypothetical protein